jgi:putative NADH-flavin reductase
MTITVFGATGQVGKQVVNQALALDFTVKAFGRNVEHLIDADNRNTKFEAIKGYVFDANEVLEAIQHSDAVISALGGNFDGTDRTRSLGMKNIVSQMQIAGVNRIIALGGLGVLNADEKTLILDSPNYPEEYKAVGLEHLQAYQYLAASSLNYTFVCAPNILNQDKTEQYITTANYPPTPNHFEINAGDIAHFMLHELKNNEFVGKRVGISRV